MMQKPEKADEVLLPDQESAESFRLEIKNIKNYAVTTTNSDGQEQATAAIDKLKSFAADEQFEVRASLSPEDDLSLYFRSFAERRRAEHDQQILFEIAEKIRRADNAENLLFALAVLVGERLKLKRCFFNEIDLKLDREIIHQDFCAPDVASIAGEHKISAYSSTTTAEIESGKTIVNRDSKQDERTAALYEKTYAPAGERAYVAVPLLRDGVWVASLWASDDNPRDWQAAEINLLETIAERAWLAVEKLRNEVNLRAAEEKLRFLFSLSQTLQNVGEPEEIMAVTARMLGEHLNVNRCAYAEVYADEDSFLITGDFVRDSFSIVGEYKMSDFGDEALRLMHENEPFVVTDVERDARTSLNLEAYRQTEIAAVISVPLHKNGRFVAGMAVHQKMPRNWSKEEIELVQIVVNRCWESIERARTVRSLRESEEKFRDLANSISQLTWIADADGAIFWYNNRWFDYTGTTLEDMKGWGWQAVHAPEEVERVTEKFKAHLASGEIWEDTFPLRSKTGEFRWFLSRARPIRDGDGKILRWFGTNTDIEELREARISAEQANHLKDEFLATLSHELRTPLNAILGWSQVLQSGSPGDDETKRALATIERSARAQNQLIEDLLDVSRITTGKIRLDVRAVDLSGVITAAVDAARPAAEAKNIRLQTLLDPQAGPISGDPDRLQQVVWNLLSNAMKFTPKDGRVQVRLERINSHIEIVISDTGRGIEPEFLPFVFDRFRQSDGSMTRRHGGLGLGLSIARQLTELHGGKISVASAGRGSGATFTVSLPLLPVRAETDLPRIHPSAAERQASALPNDYCEPELTGLRVLLVDDEDDSRNLLHTVLVSCGAIVAMANSAAEAFEMTMREPFDIIISDIGMPEEDGFSLITKIRDLPDKTGGKTPAIALTAYARSEDRIQALRSGFQMHIAKPVEPSELIAVVANLTGRIENKNGSRDA